MEAHLDDLLDALEATHDERSPRAALRTFTDRVGFDHFAFLELRGREVLNETEGAGETVQMIDGTVIRAHQCAAGARGEGLRDRVSGAREVGFRPKFISAPMEPASP